ncbi:DUF300-domain-containing protein [Hortaea werneckii]|uniref:DUF300-domain-containing protein n=1 Tax=Hortaea werneckii TaxID=91943 RepID=A0A3M7I0X4_HORWE|nr:DUF300-domain-containing protein [Hortaea werneckii]KAI6797306.1 DUF300-domain-containing protein [Hortaea werneckii]KAI6898556.1 DUF300-domain-containing protein [Hortaea werneckii]KAI6919208.1 DUF300-domain-containing protein [Hortaea werneckii]KAI6953727.1 DUF300-domain-containing protein [Hortaea werneckii]
MATLTSPSIPLPTAPLLHRLTTTGEQNEPSGTGSGFKQWILILAGLSALLACLLTVLTTLLQAKNYRKPLLQRHVIRILIMVPIFSAASWASLTSLRVAFWIDPFRDVYEAFTLYTFFQLLVAYLGGERSLIIMMHGRPPVPHLWPLNHVCGKVDISDPHTFLSIKRGILQYTWIKPLLAFATVIMKATGTFREGILSVQSGYFWTGLIYNVSICWSLYDLALFWVCTSDDLQAFRPMPKFICIKGIIFASWWQGFFLSILVWLGAIPSVGGGYTADNLAAAIQDALICFEMPFFALSHWYAFSWKDYADRTISDARMPIRFALRDAFGPRDLIEDAKETFSGNKYDYRYFDAEDNVIAHEESSSRRARMREGMRYERGGRGKYWIPSPGGANDKQPLLSKVADSHARTMSPGNGNHRSTSRGTKKDYGTQQQQTYSEDEPSTSSSSFNPNHLLLLDPEEERLYVSARALEFGDWNYPVINTHYATRHDRLRSDPNIISPSTNRAILQPGAKENRQRRKSRIQEIREDVQRGGIGGGGGGAQGDVKGRGGNKSGKDGDGGKGKRKPSSSSASSSSAAAAAAATPSHLPSALKSATSKGKAKLAHLPLVGGSLPHRNNPGTKNPDQEEHHDDDDNDETGDHQDQLVDLVVEDKQAEEIARVRARKEGGPRWNEEGEQKVFVKTFGDEEEAEERRRAGVGDGGGGDGRGWGKGEGNGDGEEEEEEEEVVPEEAEEEVFLGKNGGYQGGGAEKEERNPWAS